MEPHLSKQLWYSLPYQKPFPSPHRCSNISSIKLFFFVFQFDFLNSKFRENVHVSDSLKILINHLLREIFRISFLFNSCDALQFITLSVDHLHWNQSVTYGPFCLCEFYYRFTDISVCKLDKEHSARSYLSNTHMWLSIIPDSLLIPKWLTLPPTTWLGLYSKDTCLGNASECQCENKQNRIRLTYQGRILYYITKSTLNNFRNPFLKDISWSFFSVE